MLDANLDGMLTRYEFTNRARLSERLRWLDDNRDGAISRQEWGGTEEGFRFFDRNGDGVIRREELIG
jgi:Ca2+-binding EF-hand superfamily protein